MSAEKDEDRQYLTIRLGIQNGRATKDAIDEEQSGLYVYIDGDLLDLHSLTNNVHQVRLPLGSSTQMDAVISFEIQLLFMFL